MASDPIEAFCRAVLEGPGLAEKLRKPPESLGELRGKGAPLGPDVRPVRGPGLRLAGRVAPLPRPRALGDPAARAVCLARFAHHELMAVELFAWALLRWPGLPAGLRRGLLGVLADEQRHCRMYLERLAAHGSRLEEHPLSGYLLRPLPELAASPEGPSSFLAAVGLTFEQANLDFAPLYAEAFRRGGDPESAAVCEEVHADEVRHVALAARWLPRLSGGDRSDLECYEAAVPFPLGPARAKGRRFDEAARRAAGLSEAFIERVRSARSTQETGGG